MRRFFLTIMAVAFISMFTESSYAAKKARDSAGGKGIKGLLTVTTNAKGEVEAYLDPKTGILYNIILSSLTQGLDQVKAMSGTEVVAKGTVSEIDGKTWLKVDGSLAKAGASGSSTDKPGKEKKKNKKN